MEYRQLGRSGLKVPVLSLGTGTFGGSNEFFKRWGASDVKEASRLVDICIEAGANFFDTADIYSEGMAEEILGETLKGKRDKALIATKATFPAGDGPNEKGVVALSSDPRGGGEFETPQDGSHRHLFHARL